MGLGSILTGLPLVGPLSDLATSGTNAVMPVQRPTFDESLLAFFAGKISQQTLRTCARFEGISLAAFPPELTDPTLVVMDRFPLHLNQAYLDFRMTRWQEIVRHRTYFPTIDEVLQLSRREIIDENLTDYWLLRHCNNSGNMAAMWKEMNQEIPGPSDLIRFAVRETFDPVTLASYGYHKEFPTQILPWMRKQGYGKPIGIPIPAGGTDNNGQQRRGIATWSDLYWWSHWELPSLTNGYEMLHRLYLTSDYGRSPYASDDAWFNSAEMERLQKAQDLPDFWRKRLQAISYHPLNPSDALILHREKKISDNDYYHALRNSGYDDASAKLTMKRSIHTVTPAEAEYAYENNIIDISRLKVAYQEHGYKNEDVEWLLKVSVLRRDRNMRTDLDKFSREWVCSEYKKGVITAAKAVEVLTANGYTRLQALDFMSFCNIEIKSETIDVQLRHLRIAVLRGIFSMDEAQNQMYTIGVADHMVFEYVKRWTYERNIKVKQPQAKMVLTYFKDYILTENDAVARLFNLGYAGNDITAMISHTKLMMQQRAVAALEKQLRQQLANQKAQQKLVEKAAKEKAKKAAKDAAIVTNKANKRLRDFIKRSSDKNIKDWYKGGLLELWEVYFRLYYKGYGTVDADKWVDTNMPDTEKDEQDAAATKATLQYRRETGENPVP